MGERKSEIMNGLQRLCLPVSSFLKHHFTPHHTIIITDSTITLVADEIRIPVRRADDGHKSED